MNQRDKQDQRLSNIEADVVGIKADIAEMKKQGEKRDQRLSSIETEVLEIKEHEARQDQRLDNIEADVAEIKEYQARQDQRLDNIEADIAELKRLGLKRDQRLDNIEADIAEMKGDIAELKKQGAKRDQRLDRIEADIAEIKAIMAKMGAKIDVMQADIDVMQADIDVMQADIAQIKIDLGDLKGESLEAKLARSIRPIAAQRFQLRSPKVIQSSYELMDANLRSMLDEALNDDRISSDEYIRLEETDIILSARRKQDGSEVWIPLEASHTIGSEDVDRVKISAEILSRLLGVAIIPVAAGRSVPPNIRRRADSAGVVALVLGKDLLKL